MVSDVKSKPCTYALMMAMDSASGEPSNSPIAPGLSLELESRKNAADCSGSFDRVASASAWGEGLALNASTAFSTVTLVFFAF